MRNKNIRTIVLFVAFAVIIIGSACMLPSITGYTQIPDGDVAMAPTIGEYSSVTDHVARMSVSSIELFCIGMILLLLIYVIFTIKITNKGSAKPLLAFCLVCLSSLVRYVSNIITYFNDGIPTAVALKLSQFWTFVLFFSTYLLVLSLAYYLYTYVSEKAEVNRSIVSVSGWSTVVAFIALEINYTHGIFYKFGETNEYIRGEYYVFYYIVLFLVFMYAICWLFKYRKLLLKKEFAALFMIAVFPIVGSVVQILFPKYNPSDAFITAGIVISFLCLQFSITDSEIKDRVSTENELIGISQMFMGAYRWNPKTNQLENRSLKGDFSDMVVSAWINNESYIDHYVHENDRAALKQALSPDNLKEMYEAENRIVKEYEFRELSSGKYVWRRAIFFHQEPEADNQKQLFMVVQDITEERNLIEHSAAQTRRFIGTCAGVYSAIYEWQLETNIARKLRFSNAGVEELDFDENWERTIRERFEKIVFPDDKSAAERVLPENIKDLKVGQTKSESCRLDFTGTFRWHTVTAKMLSDEDGRKVVLYLMQDIDDAVHEHNRLKDRSEHDEMTDLFNRAKLEDMKNSEYKNLKSCGILFFDINNLKTTNDTLGHNAGDEMIMIAADSIRSITNRRILGYRIGGDEMIVVVADADCEEMDQLFSLWQARLAEMNAKATVNCEIAVGRAWGEGKFNFDDLLAEADAAMYENKQKLKGLK